MQAQQVGQRWGSLAPVPRNPNFKYKSMEEDLKRLADLITANIKYCAKEVLTSDEAARYLGITRGYLCKLTMNRQIPYYKSPTGKMNYFNRKELEKWLQSCKVPTLEEIEQQALAYNLKR